MLEYARKNLFNIPPLPCIQGFRGAHMCLGWPVSPAGGSHREPGIVGCWDCRVEAGSWDLALGLGYCRRLGFWLLIGHCWKQALLASRLFYDSLLSSKVVCGTFQSTVLMAGKEEAGVSELVSERGKENEQALLFQKTSVPSPWEWHQRIFSKWSMFPFRDYSIGWSKSPGNSSWQLWASL